MTFVAGELMWANVKPYTTQIFDDVLKVTDTLYCYGWPYCTVVEVRQTQWTWSDDVDYYWAFNEINGHNMIVYKKLFLFDVAAVLTILFAVWFLCEWIIHRRRAARKESQLQRSKLL